MLILRLLVVLSKRLTVSSHVQVLARVVASLGRLLRWLVTRIADFTKSKGVQFLRLFNVRVNAFARRLVQ